MTERQPAVLRPGAARAQDSASRMRWMDVLRGTAILLVVLSHATRVLDEVVPGSAVLSWLDRFFTPYRMPMLMFLSGMLLPRALAKPLPAYYLGKVRRLLWPYVVWVLALGAIGAAPGPLTDPRTWYATSYLWYLFFLLCYFTVAPLARRLPPWSVAVAAVGLVVASTFVDPASDGRTQLMLFLGAFFALGHVAASLPRLLARCTTPGTAPALVVAVLGVVPGLVAVTTGYEARSGLFAAFSTVGVLATVVLARMWVAAGGTRFVEWIGRSSIVVYTVHYPVLLLGADLLARTTFSSGVLGGTLVVVAAALLSLGIGCAVAWARRLPGVDWLFVMPFPERLLRRPPFVRREAQDTQAIHP